MTREQRLVERKVRSEDPNLSPRANRVLTEETREAVGSDRARVPAGKGRTDAGSGSSGSLTDAVSSNRPFLLISFMVLLAVGVIVSLATGNWIALAAALAIHFVTTVIVVGGALQMSTTTEHASPEAAARLEEEGVMDPDRHLTELVREYRTEGRDR